MSRLPLLSLLVVVFSTSLFAQTRERVFIVKPNIQNRTKEQFLEAADSWENHEDWFADWLRGQAEGGHGSGFLYVDDQGDNYIITNKHVVLHAESADVVQRVGRTDTVFPDCPILYISDTTDLAILTFPEYAREFDAGFPISLEDIRDGDEVFSAGYPGLPGTNEALWQFAKGSVTNNQAYVDSLLPDEEEYLIQHSANVDHGNSGGPLLKRSGEDFSVVGVNTYSLVDLGRDNTFLSIPSQILLDVLREAMAVRKGTTPDNARDQLETACLELADLVNGGGGDERSAYRLISEATIAEDGLPSLDRLFEHRSKNEVERLWESFLASPWDTLRYATGEYLLEAMLRRAPVEYIGIDSGDLEVFNTDQRTSVRTEFKDNRTGHIVTWIFEYGKWRISQIDSERLEKAERNQVSIQSSDESDPGEEEVDSDPELPSISKAEQKNFIYGFVSIGLSPLFADEDAYVDGLFESGAGYWHGFQRIPLYFTMDVATGFTPLEVVLSTGYHRHLTQSIRFQIGIGVAAGLYHYVDGPVVSDYFRAYPVLETGLHFRLWGALTLGYRFRYIPDIHSGRDNRPTRLNNMVQLGFSW